MRSTPRSTSQRSRPQRETGPSGRAAEIMRFLKAVPGSHWHRNPPGAFSTRGRPDITGVYRSIAVAAEVKLEGNAPTPLQAAELAAWRDAGGIAGVVHTVDEMRELLAEAEVLATRLHGPLAPSISFPDRRLPAYADDAQEDDLAS